MARGNRFPLIMSGGAVVNTLEELQANFDLQIILGYFADGKLQTWLADRYHEEKAEAIGTLSTDMPDLSRRILDILEIDTDTECSLVDSDLHQKINTNRQRLAEFTDDKEILAHADAAVFNQEELFEALDAGFCTVYLCGEEFSIPSGRKMKYVGLNNPLVKLENNKTRMNYEGAGITFEGVSFEEDAIRGDQSELLFSQGKYAEAHPLVKRKAESGAPRAMYMMVLYYANGYGTVKTDLERAKEWCRNAKSHDDPMLLYAYASRCISVTSDEAKEILAQIFPQIIAMSEEGNVLAEDLLGNMLYWGYGTAQNKAEAFQWYMKAANQGFADAQCHIGWVYQHGYSENNVKAAEWYQKAAEQGYVQAQYHLGNLYQTGKGVPLDKCKSAEWHKKAAEQGFLGSQAKLGGFYEQGWGVPMNLTEAVRWYETAANQGIANAQLSLGNCLFSGRGIAQDYVKAVGWYQKAAEQGIPQAQLHLADCFYSGQGVLTDYAKAVSWYQKAAEKGILTAQSRLGDCYYFGKGVGRDYQKAMECYRKAAEKGGASAQARLGDCYFYGNGVLQSIETAATWYEKAARVGNADAQYGLANIHLKKYEFSKANELFRKAAENGQAAAQGRLGNDYYKGNGVEKNIIVALEWHKKAAQQGYAPSQGFLGDCYFFGYCGVAKDYACAAEWYTKAIENGFHEAEAVLGWMYENGFGVSQDKMKAKQLFQSIGANTAARPEGVTCNSEMYMIAGEPEIVPIWLRVAAELGNEEAQFKLGTMYYSGDRVAKNTNIGIMWFKIAASNGSYEAKQILKAAGIHI